MIILLGIAGSGKSTQAQLLAEKLGSPWISTGEIARTRLTGQQREKMLAGEIIDDHIILPLLEDELKKHDAKSRECILDGFPRTLNQAQWLLQNIKNGNIKYRAAVHLKLEAAEAGQRLLDRGRSDDSDAAITQRFKEYKDVILPILKFLEANNLAVFEVNAAQPPETVAKDIQKILGLSS